MRITKTMKINKILYENSENHENSNTPQKNYANHENIRNPLDN